MPLEVVVAQGGLCRFQPDELVGAIDSSYDRRGDRRFELAKGLDEPGIGMFIRALKEHEVRVSLWQAVDLQAATPEDVLAYLTSIAHAKVLPWDRNFTGASVSSSP